MWAGCPGHHWKEKETPDDNGEGITGKPQSNQTPAQQPTNNKKGGRRPSPHCLEVFPLYGGETGETVGYVPSKGLNSQKDLSGEVGARGKCHKANQRGFVPP